MPALLVKCPIHIFNDQDMITLYTDANWLKKNNQNLVKGT